MELYVLSMCCLDDIALKTYLFTSYLSASYVSIRYTFFL